MLMSRLYSLISSKSAQHCWHLTFSFYRGISSSLKHLRRLNGCQKTALCNNNPIVHTAQILLFAVDMTSTLTLQLRWAESTQTWFNWSLRLASDTFWVASATQMSWHFIVHSVQVAVWIWSSILCRPKHCCSGTWIWGLNWSTWTATSWFR